MAVLAEKLSGVLIHRFTSRRTVIAAVLLAGVAFALVAAGYLIGVVPVGIGLFLFGLANGAWDPAQNVQGASRRAAGGRRSSATGGC